MTSSRFLSAARRVLLPPILALAAAPLTALFAQGDPGTVLSHQKISATQGGGPTGLDQGDQFGRSVDLLGDLDGDGYVEIAVGAQNDDDGGMLGSDSNVGAVYVLFLQSDGSAKATTKISATQGGLVSDLENLDGFGRACAGLGDFDGDGVGDLVVGASRDDDGGVNHGAVYIILLNSDGTVKSNQKISDTEGGFTGLLRDLDEFGRGVSPIGDLDGDGVTDIAVGAPFDDDGGNMRGAVWILFLNSDGTVKAHQKISALEGGFTGGTAFEDMFGLAVEGIGDLDGDGVPDLAAGAPKDDDGGPRSGSVWILFLNTDGTVKGHQQISNDVGGMNSLIGSEDEFGTSIGSLGDFDADGVDDLVVGAILNDGGLQNNGAVWVLFMNSDGTVHDQQKINDLEGNFSGPLHPEDWFGSGVTTIGDFDGDGQGDIAVGCRFDDDGGFNQNRGAVYVMKMEGFITQPPFPNFTATPRTGMVPLTVDFTGTSTAGAFAWNWDFGDGGTSPLAIVSHEYTAPGSYDVSFSTSGPGGLQALTRPGYIVVDAPPPTAEFSATPLTGEAPLSVTFTDLSYDWVDAWTWDFGDGGSSTAQHPAHVFEAVGTFTVTLTAHGPGGSDDETKVDYVVTVPPPPPVAEFSATPLAGEAPLLVDFTDLATGQINTWGWDFGDGGTSSEASPSYLFTTPGTFTVSLTVEGFGGAHTETKLDYVAATTPPAPSTDFSAAPLSGDAPLDVVFTDLTVGNVNQWQWDFGDGGSSIEQHPGYHYALPGTYTVSLTTVGLGGSDSETKVDYIVAAVPPVPDAEFVATPLSGDAPLEVAFTDLSTRHHTTWLWTFGDGGTSSETNPVHLYALPGTYTVSLTVEGLGGIDTETKVDYVAANTPPAPVAAFSGTPLSGDAPLRVQFTDLSSGQHDQWTWDYGDGSQAFGPNPYHFFENPGTYTVSLTVTGLGGTDTLTQVDYVVADVPPPPTAAFSATPTRGDAALEVTFTDLSTGHVDQWQWNFGDGATSTQWAPVHRYDNPGSYSVTLTATGLGGSDDETLVDYIVVNVPPPPTADFTGSPLSGVAPLTVNFTDTSTGNVTSWSWSFGDGGTSTAQHPSYTFTTPGSWSVTLTATGHGGSDGQTKTDYVVVDEPPPTADFSGSPLSGPAPLDVVFTDLTAGDVSSWSWSFGDGGSATAQHPTYRYETPGTYAVTLTATGAGGSDGETKADYVVVDVPPPPVAEFSATPTTGEAPLDVAFTDLSTGEVDRWAWDFGDGTTSTLQNPTHQYEEVGTFSVSLTATGLGGPDTMLKIDHIVADPPPPPVVDFYAYPATGDAPLEVKFTDLTTGHANQWAWDFGDGGTSSSRHPLWVYETPGTFTVALTVTGLGGVVTETKVDFIAAEVPPAPIVDFSGTPLFGSAPLTVDFTNLTTGHVSGWTWDFGDGGISADQTPSYVFTFPGTYTVTLAAVGLGGSDSITRTDYVVVETTGLQDPSFELQTAATAPAAPWTTIFGSAHLVQPDGVTTDGDFPVDGLQWLEISADGTVAATPPTNPGGETQPAVGGAGVRQNFLYAEGRTTLRFEAAFLRDGPASEPAFNDWMSVDVTDGSRVWNLYYADTFTATPLVSARYGLPMTERERVITDLATLFPASTNGTVFTLTVQIGNGGDGLRSSRGFVDHFLHGPAATTTLRNGTGINPDVFRSLTRPVLGEVWEMQIDATTIPVAGLTIVLGSSAPLGPIPSLFGEILVAPAPLGIELFTTIVHSGGTIATHSLQIPPDIVYLGATAYTQAAVLWRDGPILTNAIDVVVGL